MKAQTRPVRSCLACGQKKDQRDLVRIVRTTSGAVEIDKAGKRPGRGAYLCRLPVCRDNGLSKGALERTLRTSVDSSMVDRLRRQTDWDGSVESHKEKR